MAKSYVDEVISCLSRLGVSQVFGIPGTHNLGLYRALLESGMSIIPAHHEQGLGYAADGLARVTGEPAVVVTTTGPGITNLITALATSAAASVPVLAIAPGLPVTAGDEGVGWLHALPNQSALMSQLVTSCRALTAAEAVAFIESWARQCRHARPMPAYLELPLDLLNIGADAPPEPGESSDTVNLLQDPQETSAITRAHLSEAAQMLAVAQRPVIIAGRGACSSPAVLRTVAEFLNAPVFTTANGKGVMPESHTLSLGVSLRVSSSRELLKKADAVLVVGSDLGSSEFWGEPSLGSSGTVRIDADPRNLRANVVPEIELLGRAETILPELLQALEARGAVQPEVRPADWRGSAVAYVGDRAHKPTAHWASALAFDIRAELEGGSEPYRELHAVMQEESARWSTIVTGDSSQVSYFGTATFWRSEAPNQFLYPAGYGTLGYAVPSAIGAALSGQAERVLAITGEGGLLFSVQELATVAELCLPIVTVVFINGGYREIREGMRERGIPETGVNFPTPDFVSLAKGFHLPAVRVQSDERDESEFRAVFRASIENAQPSLIEVVLSNDA